MATIDELRAEILRYKDVKEADKSTGFRAATFKLKGKGIIGIEKNMEYATFSLNQQDVNEVLADSNLMAEAISKNGVFIGARINLHRLTSTMLSELVAKSVRSQS